MTLVPPGSASNDPRTRDESHNAGAWAAAAVLVIAVVLASGAVS